MQLIDREDSSFKKGLALQREQFKAGKNGTGDNNYDLMADAIENIKSEIKSRALSAGNKESIERVENILHWFRTKELAYTVPTEDGPQVIFPATMHLRSNKKLTIAYEILIEQMDRLELL